MRGSEKNSARTIVNGLRMFANAVPPRFNGRSRGLRCAQSTACTNPVRARGRQGVRFSRAHGLSRRNAAKKGALTGAFCRSRGLRFAQSTACTNPARARGAAGRTILAGSRFEPPQRRQKRRPDGRFLPQSGLALRAKHCVHEPRPRERGGRAYDSRGLTV